MKDYRNSFISPLVVCGLLAASLAFVGWRYVLHRGTQKALPGGIALQPASAAALGEASAPPPPATGQVPLVPVQLTPQRMQSIGITSGEVQVKPLSAEVRAEGNVAVDERRQAYVQTRFSGWIQQVFADSTYQYVHKGQPLFTIYSPDLVTTEREYLLARSNQDLLQSSTVPGVTAGANALLGAAQERLQQWEIPQREIQHLESTGQVRQNLEIDSPASGFITERNVLPNLYVQPGTKLYTVADLSTVWVFAQVFQTDIGQIRVGESAEVTSDAYPARTFYGRVDFIYPEVDMSTRAARVRLVFANPGLRLTPGMFVNVALRVPLGRAIAVPASGVFQTGTRNIVFVDHGQGYLEPREVTLGTRAGDEFPVLKGLKSGERVVTSANFLVDSESQLQAALGSFVPPPPGAGAAASLNTLPQASMEFSTVPSRLTKGPMALHIRLTANGAPVSGAAVTATFYMPAMPAMGMAAMRTVVKLSDKGGGIYQGSGQLQSGGTWQVTLIAQKGGQTLATKQFTLNAEGGM
jgi:membrane fusion protein, copper/silver efflux system